MDIVIRGRNEKDAISAAAVSSIGRQQTDAYSQDRTTDPIILYFNKILSSTTLATDAVKDTFEIEVVSATNIIAGRYLILFNLAAERFSAFFVESIAGTTVTLDRSGVWFTWAWRCTWIRSYCQYNSN